MESSGYVDIFATKGIEYLLVLGFLFSLILYWKFLSQPAGRAPALAAASRPVFSLNPWFSLAEGLFYHQGHSWAVPEQRNVVRVGIDDFAQQLLGELSSVDLPQIGTRLEQGEKGWKLWVDSKSIDVLSPVEGKVLAVNEEILKVPDLINQDPYRKGWLMKVEVPNTKKNLKNLLSGRLAKAWMEETVDTLRQKMGGELGIALQDGGVPIAGIARALSPDKWDEVAMEFLLSK